MASNQKARDVQRERRAKGLCCSCSKKAVPGEARCPDCKEAARITARARYQARRAAQICPLCRDPEKAIVTGKTCCRDCLDKQAKSTASRRETYKPRQKELQQEYYAER